MNTKEDIKLTMEIIMHNTVIKEMPAVLRLIAKDMENGINRGIDRSTNNINKKYSFETTLSPVHLVSKFFK